MFSLPCCCAAVFCLCSEQLQSPLTHLRHTLHAEFVDENKMKELESWSVPDLIA